MTEFDQADRDFREQVIRLQDGALSAEEIERLEDVLRSDPERRQVYMQIERQSASIARLLQRAAFSEQQTRPARVVPVTIPSRHWLAGDLRVLISLIAAVCALVALFCTLPPRNEFVAHADIRLANITYANNAKWSSVGASEPNDGIHLSNQTPYHLTSGSVRMKMPGGAIVSVAAPAAFTIVDGNRLNLTHGRLTARGTWPTSELNIQAGNLGIRDCGTAFGVDASENGDVNVAVFDGQVEVGFDESHVKARGNVPTTKRIVSEGQAIASTRESTVAKSIEFDVRRFADLWPLTVGIDEASQIVNFVPPGPEIDLDSLGSDDKLFLIPERLNHRLTRPIRVDLIGPGTSWPRPERDVDIPTLSKGRVLSSYLLMFKPSTQRARTYRTLSGSITFEKPIAALSVQGKRLERSEDIFGDPKIPYASMAGRTLEDRTSGVADTPADSLKISKDGKRLDFELHINVRSDHIRVLVDESSSKLADTMD